MEQAELLQVAKDRASFLFNCVMAGKAFHVVSSMALLPATLIHSYCSHNKGFEEPSYFIC